MVKLLRGSGSETVTGGPASFHAEWRPWIVAGSVPPEHAYPQRESVLPWRYQRVKESQTPPRLRHPSSYYHTENQSFMDAH